jgi:hypothetical protein
MKSPPGKGTCALLQMPVTNGPEQPVTTSQLARHLQVNARTLGAYRAQQRIPYWRVNSRCIRYRISDVEAALSK